MACMTRQGAREFALQLRQATEVEFLRLLGSLSEGRLIGEFNATSREVLHLWMAQAGIHYEWVLRLDLEATGDDFREL
jgi:hypothetical protein